MKEDEYWQPSATGTAERKGKKRRQKSLNYNSASNSQSLNYSRGNKCSADFQTFVPESCSLSQN